MKILLILFLSISQLAFSMTPQSREAIEVFSALFPDIAGKKTTTKIETKDCKPQKDKWSMLLLTKESFTETFRFSKGCDLDGSFRPQMDKFFPVNLKIRNLKDYQTIQAQVKASIFFENEMLLKTTIKDAKLKGKQTNEFSLEYTVVLDPLGGDNIIKKRKGGTLYLRGKKGITKVSLK